MVIPGIIGITTTLIENTCIDGNPFLFSNPLPLASCQMDRAKEPVIETESLTENTREADPPRYHSDITSENCFLCEEGKGMPLSMYCGQKEQG
jgi:hypothetical protein